MDSWIVPAVLLALLCAAAYITDRRVRRRGRPPVHEFRMAHKPVPDDLQLVFGGYAGGHDVKSLIVKQNGIHVTYKDGSAYLFLAVPEGESAYFHEGQIKVTEDGQMPS